MPLLSNLCPLTVNIVLLMPAGHLKRIGLIQVKFEPQTSLFKAIGCSSWKKERKFSNVTTRSTFAVYSMELFLWPSCMIETELQRSHDAPCWLASQIQWICGKQSTVHASSTYYVVGAENGGVRSGFY